MNGAGIICHQIAGCIQCFHRHMKGRSWIGMRRSRQPQMRGRAGHGEARATGDPSTAGNQRLVPGGI